MNLFQLTRVSHNAGISRNQNARYAENRCIFSCLLLTDLKLPNIGSTNENSAPDGTACNFRIQNNIKFWFQVGEVYEHIHYILFCCFRQTLFVSPDWNIRFPSNATSIHGSLNIWMDRVVTVTVDWIKYTNKSISIIYLYYVVGLIQSIINW